MKSTSFFSIIVECILFTTNLRQFLPRPDLVIPFFRGPTQPESPCSAAPRDQKLPRGFDRSGGTAAETAFGFAVV